MYVTVYAFSLGAPPPTEVGGFRAWGRAQRRFLMKLSSAGLAECVGQDNQGDRHAHEYQHGLAHVTQYLQIFRIHKFLPHHLKTVVPGLVTGLNIEIKRP
jgi:hypothetical protein